MVEKASFWTQVKLLVWKNWILQKRRPVSTAAELIVPTLLFLILWGIRAAIDATQTQDVIFCSQPVSVFDYPRSYNIPDAALTTNFPDSGWHCDESFTFETAASNVTPAIGFYPNSPQVESIMDTVRKQVALHSQVPPAVIQLVGFDNYTDFENLGDLQQFDFLFGAAFYVDDAEAIPGLDIASHSVFYHLRLSSLADTGAFSTKWETDRLFPEFETLGPSYNPAYTSAGKFSYYQTAIDTAIMMAEMGRTSDDIVTRVFEPFTPRLKPMPWPSYSDDGFVYAISSTFPLILVISYIYTAMSLMRNLVYEREKRLKEAMNMMGLTSFVHWLSWFIKSFLFLIITVILNTIIFAAAGLSTYSDNSVVFVLLLLFALNVIFFAFAASTLFNKSSTAAGMGGVLFFTTFVPYLALQASIETLSPGAKAAMCLLPTSCVGIGANILSHFESNGLGSRWSTLSRGRTEFDSFSMQDVFVMLLVDCFIYMLLTWYISHVKPGEFGRPKPFYFFLKPSFWCRKTKPLDEVEMQVLKDTKTEALDVESDPDGLQVGVEIKNLSKVFKAQTGGTTVAVNDLSVKMFKNQITALLGHNGAGKTTTLSMLVGLYGPSSGTASVNGHDILDEPDLVRDSLGLCPQFDVLFDLLTVEEHIVFYSRLKGLTIDDANKNVKQLSKDIDLEEKTDSQIRTLSGGQKRAVSVAVAFCGASDTIILDEPTSGMDPFKRRQTWDLLLKYKENRTIILTTHFMEEADVLGDRIAIMADGQLKTLGSSHFLKQKFGAGYHLTMAKAEKFDENAVKTFVKDRIKDAKLTSNLATEAVMVMPQNQSQKFPTLFEELDKNLESFGIDGYGMSITTMEEVFLKVAEGRNRAQNVVHELEESTSTTKTQSQVTDDYYIASMSEQFKAMFIKRALFAKRDKGAIIPQLILPILFAIFAIVIAQSGLSQDPSEPPLRLNLSGYDINNLRYSFESTSRDYTSGVDPQFHDLLQQLNGANRTSLQDYDTDMSNLLLDPRFTTATGNNLGSVNYSGVLLNESIGYQRNEYFKKNLIGVTLEPGPFYIASSNGTCQMWNGETYSNLTSLTLTRGFTYVFKKYGDLLIEVNENGTDTPSFAVQNETGLFVSIPNDEPGPWYLWCDSTQSSGVPIQLDDTQSTDSMSTIGYAWFSMAALHSVAQSLNFVNNLAWQHLTGNSTARIVTTNDPLPRTTTDKLDDILSDFTGFNLAVNMALSGSFLMASFALFVVTEKQTKAKHIQLVSGVNIPVYWIANYAWDLMTSLIPSIGIIIIFAAFDLEAFRGNELGVVFFLLISFAFGAIPLIYVMSYVIENPSAAYARLSMLFLFVGIATVITVFILNLLEFESESDICKHVFLLIPNFALGQGLLDMYFNYQYGEICGASEASIQICNSLGYQYRPDPLDFQFHGVGKHILFLFMSGIFWFLLLLGIDLRIFSRKSKFSRDEEDKIQEIDTDVAAEAVRVREASKSPTNTDKVLVDSVYRYFNKKVDGKTRKFAAVNGVTFGIKRGECFGLLGVNGAGKTTLFRMLTGEIASSSGYIEVAGYNMSSDRNKARHHMGYCPQFDALLELLTAKELLFMYARLRGVPEEKIPDVVDDLIQQLDLADYANKPCGGYSGGNKRKLSTAIALVGDPEIVFLDEPTTGMDPASRRFLWGVLYSVLKRGQAIVLTSHSMEECEVLCSRLAIMVNGQFKCIGSPQHLKNKFGGGFTVTITVPIDDGRDEDALDHVRTFITEKMKGAVEKSCYGGTITFKVTNEDRGWSYMFSQLEDARENFAIEDYSISQTSLEEVFLYFAAEQHVDEKLRYQGNELEKHLSRPHTASTKSNQQVDWV